ncbi:aminoglycoside phosphotransferase family protein [Streptomyces sp. HNM0663]|uniref:Aminoglycoside phosphotransferase family protein n=1 Tax=Streptomyces chengmaiensis TaxID=3040919 RepID=A0ABT6HXB6_9ACTN|nr:aminoglycoside phosphotransferase family protein [Streptomyces chengmaiensis]MDH2393342.1 aminoglycoside phosphotransferase family protein [Streptomyces chengmaiensis]
MTTATLDRTALRRLLPGAKTLSARPLPQGRFNTCWHLADSDRAYLLKLNDREGEAHLRQMAAAMSAARAGGVAVPQVLRVGADPDLGPFLLQEWLDGRTFAEARQDNAITADLWPRLGRQIALLHSIQPPRPLMATPASRARQLADLLDGLRWHQLIPTALAEAARQRGLRLAETLGDHECVNTHQDIHPDNILIRPGGKIALLDFDHATTAEYASDFVKPDRWCLPSAHDRQQMLDAYWHQRGQVADPLLEQRLAFHRLVITLSYFLYWHGRDPTQLPGCTAALRTELERT